jgi:hypothetical protein
MRLGPHLEPQLAGSQMADMGMRLVALAERIELAGVPHART